MSYTKQALSLVGEVEKQLREIMREAVAAADYDAVEVIARWAAYLRRLTVDREQIQEKRIGLSESERPGLALVSTARSGRAPKTSRSRYPHFFLDGDQLVKTGWSKSKRKEYEQKASRKVLDLLIEAIVSVIPSKPRFKMEDVLPLYDEEHAEIPSYQVYLHLAWLREIKAVAQHGRDGYSVRSQAELRRLAAEGWDRLRDRAQHPQAI